MLGRKRLPGIQVDQEDFMKIVIVNCTPHPLNFIGEDGVEFVVPQSGAVINAELVEQPAGTHSAGVELVRVGFRPAPGAEETLARLEAEHPDALFVASMIAAQAFPGRIVNPIPAPGFERRPPAEKRMRSDKFTTF